MGKKNKRNTNNNATGEIGIKIKKQFTNELVSKSDSMENKMPKKIIFNDNDEAHEQMVTNLDIANDSSKEKNNTISRKRKKNAESNSDTNKIENKKIIFDDTESEPQSEDINRHKSSKRKSKPTQNEDEPKEEDIDKFCDELGEEDNKQYEDWIKLVEAKLKSNKK